MKKFVININSGDRFLIEAESARSAARIARSMGRGLMKTQQ